MKYFGLVLIGFVGCAAPAWGQSAEQKHATIAYLQGLQAADGGFLPARPKAQDRPAKSSLSASSGALRALEYFGGEPKDKEACAQFVRKCFDPAGGGFADYPGGDTNVHTTAVGLMALVELKVPVAEYRKTAVDYLTSKSKTFEDIRIAAAGFEALRERPAQADAWLEQVAKMRHEDGTYGQGDGVARATGGAVAAVLRLGGKVAHRDQVIQALKAGQRSDGGFGKERASGSDLETSYRVMRSFHMLKEKPDAERLRAFVARCRNADGGYGVAPGQPSGVGSTYFAAMILHWLADEAAGGRQARRTYDNRLTPLAGPKPLLADYPEFVEPIRETARFEASVLVDDADANLHVRAWRFSYNARGIIEVPNRLRAEQTAVIVVHPWAIDDGQGWTTPEPAGVAFACTPEKNRLALRHMAEVVNPFLKSLRGKVGLVAYSLPGSEDPIRKKLYRSIHGRPSAAEGRQGATELTAKLKGFSYKGEPVAARLEVSTDKPVADYFRQFPGLDSGATFNHAGFWDLPIPVARPLQVDPADVVIYDAEGYGALKGFLQKQGIRNILLTGYHADMCVCKTTAGYQNLAKDFNVFLVGDATQATFPASDTPRFATTAALSFAALEQLITQVSWVRYQDSRQSRTGS